MDKNERDSKMDKGVLFQVKYKGKIVDVYGMVGIGAGAHFVCYDAESRHFMNVLVDRCEHV